MSLAEVADWRTQVLFWGHYMTGELLEPAALVAENSTVMHPWDHTIDYLDSIQRWHNTVRMPVPWWWAFACAPDLVVDRWPGLKAVGW